MTDFLNPYADLPDSEVHRTTIVCDKNDYAFVMRLHGRKGAFQNTIYVLITRTIEQLKAKGITEYDPIRYERAVAGLTVTLGDGSPVHSGSGGTVDDRQKPTSVEQVPDGDDAARTRSVVQPDTAANEQLRVVPSTRKGKSTEGRKGGQKGKH